MRLKSNFLIFAILFFILIPTASTEEYSLSYFMKKISSKEVELSRRDRGELLNHLNDVLERAKEVCLKLIQAIQTGETELKYQEGKFWLSKLEDDQKSIEMGIQQLKLLKEKQTHLSASIKLYKSLKDLSFHLNAYNNVPSFSGLVGDIAPEMELWADPIFYQLFLLPLAHSKEKGTGVSPKDKRPITKPKSH